jgi:hypothetical protein
VRYTVERNPGAFDRQLRVRGLSGLNPPATHTISIVR